MGNLANQRDKNKTTLSPELYKDIMEVFEKIDVNNSKSIDKAETLKYWKSNFAKINTEQLFKAVDTDNSGDISKDEWIAFWEHVKQAGYSDEDIQQEVDSLKEGSAWVQFDMKKHKKHH